VKLEVLRRHGIRSRQVWLDVFVEPRLLPGLALPDFADGESAGRRIRDVDDEAGLLLHQLVESGRHLVETFVLQLRKGWTEFWSRTWLWVIVLEFSCVNVLIFAVSMDIGNDRWSAHSPPRVGCRRPFARGWLPARSVERGDSHSFQ